ncbi:MAG: low specificity L-threonine aldolase [Clostridia bacterium]|nr:low specificity L-threonine aldolase [Clostridia bacterium]
MIRLESDYTQGAVPEIIARLTETNMEMTPGYGEDEYCFSAAERIKKECDMPTADVHFLVGGTQTNLLFISSVLRPHQGVMCAHTGHINAHETGAVEATGHKVLALGSKDGTLTAKQVKETLDAHYADTTHEHIVQPAMVYVSFPTENGTLYSKAQLTELSELCRERDIPLYLDGARLGYGLMSEKNDLTMADIARLCDAFYIGGTKVGALFGEALVITNDKYKKDFRYIEKQKGAMLAKGRLLGLQFDTLFTDGLYYKISTHAVCLAKKIRDAFEKKNIPLYFDSPTNQQFPCLTDEQMKKLSEDFAFSYWCKAGDRHAVRFCTSWATRSEDVERLIEEIRSL